MQALHVYLFIFCYDFFHGYWLKPTTFSMWPRMITTWANQCCQFDFKKLYCLTLNTDGFEHLLQLKQNGWIGNFSLGASYISLPWCSKFSIPERFRIYFLFIYLFLIFGTYLISLLRSHNFLIVIMACIITL